MKPLIFLICAGLIQTCYVSGQEKKAIAPVRSQTKHVTYKPTTVQEIKSVKLLPDLLIRDIIFTDENSNRIINSDERNEISLKLVNEGKGVAEGVIFRVSTRNPGPGMSYTPEFKIGDISPGKQVDIKVPITTDMTLQTGTAEFTLVAVENNGFDSFTHEVNIPTQQFQKPNILVADAVFSTEEGGKIVRNYPINLKILVQNLGQGDASDVKAEFKFMRENCIMLDSTNRYELGSLKPGEAVELEFPFTATRRYSDTQIPIRIELEEKYNQYARDTLVSVGLNQSLQAKSQVIIQGKSSGDLNFERASLVADVDRNIPENAVKYTNKYALIIGNEDYTSRQTGIRSESNVIYAGRDAEFFREYVIKTLGIDGENVDFIKDATYAEMNQAIDLISKKAQRVNNAEIVFYFAGHGYPDEKSEIPYLIPVDVTGANLTNAIRLTDLYRKLEESKAKQVSVFLDACFSGGGRNDEYLATRGIRIKPKLEIPPANTIVFSASSGDQSALPYTTKQHGIFTYFLLKKLQDTQGNLTYGELADYLQTQVSLQSLRINKKEQDPQIIYGNNNRDNWINKPVK